MQAAFIAGLRLWATNPGMLNHFLTFGVIKLANTKLISNLFVQLSTGDKQWNEGKKNSIDFVIKLNKDDWMFERSVTTRDQHKSFKL